MTLAVCLAALATAAAVDAPITDVTVYSDRARVTRTATVRLAGSQRVDFPVLPEGADPSTVRLGATGAEVRAVDITRLAPGELPLDDGRKLLKELEALDDQLDRTRAERDAHRVTLELLGGLVPVAPPDEPLRPPAKLDPVGWTQAEGFVADYTARLQKRVRELGSTLEELERRQARVREQARLLGTSRREGGHRVSALVQGSGAATLRLSYVIAKARWLPTYDIQLFPATNQVRLAFSGLVSQQTGEDWRDAALTLSTAVPATSTVVPKLLTWKLGSKERFIPTPEPLAEPLKPPPAAPPLPSEVRESDRLRDQLLARVEGKERAMKTEEDVKAPEKPPESTKQQEMGKDLTRLESTAEAPKPANTIVAGGARIEGNVIDAATHKPVADVVVTATSPSAPGEQVVVTDDTGAFRIPRLPPGRYAVRFEGPGYKPSARSDIELRPGAELRMQVELLPEVAAVESIEVAGRAPDIDTSSSTTGFSFSNDRASVPSGGERYVPSVVAGTLAPPPGYVAPIYDPELPASLAGGYDLSFPSLRRETLESGKGARRVALFSETWPVTVERKIYPALAAEAFLVAELKSPSQRVLPGGTANLAVGDDPAGSARIKRVAPGEGFTLPLGIDRAIKPVRNVQLVQTEQGLIGKDDVGEYAVTDEISNPYPFPIKTRIYDQWPLPSDQDVQISLLRTEPWAIQDKAKGSLEWDLVVPPNGKVTVSFAYSLRRPKGWRLQQQQ